MREGRGTSRCRDGYVRISWFVTQEEFLKQGLFIKVAEGSDDKAL